MNPIISWTIVLVVVGGLTWYYTGRPNLLEKLTPPSATTKTSSSSIRSKNRRRDKRGLLEKDNLDSARDGSSTMSDMGVPGTGSGVNKKRKINKPATKEQTAPDSGVGSGVEDEEDAMNMKDFAKQMAQAREGTKVVSSAQSSKKGNNGGKNKAPLVEEEQAGVTSSPMVSTGASSTTGGDADDDLSPVASPPLGATKASDVSDMLEEPTKGPSVLRLTQSQPTRQVTAKPASKPTQPEETKKQRQARKKREAQREQIEEAERHRKLLMEKQIQGARMAAGTSNQQKANAFTSKPPTTNAWQTVGDKRTANAPQKEATPSIPLLDTFDNDATPTGQGNESSSVETKESAASVASSDEPSTTLQDSVNALKKAVGIGSKNNDTKLGKENKPLMNAIVPTSWADNIPSEEEQIRRLKEEDEDSWATVKNKKKKVGKAGKETDSASGGEPTMTNGNARKNLSPPVESSKSQTSGSYGALATE